MGHAVGQAACPEIATIPIAQLPTRARWITPEREPNGSLPARSRSPAAAGAAANLHGEGESFRKKGHFCRRRWLESWFQKPQV